MFGRIVRLVLAIPVFFFLCLWKLKEVWEDVLGIAVVGVLSLGLLLNIKPNDDSGTKLVVIFCAGAIALGALAAWAKSGVGFQFFLAHAKKRIGISLALVGFILLVPSPSSAPVRYITAAVLCWMLVGPVFTVGREMRKLPHELVNFWRRQSNG